MRKIFIMCLQLMIVLSFVACMNVNSKPKEIYNTDSISISSATNDTAAILCSSSTLPMRIMVSNELDSMELMKKMIAGLKTISFHDGVAITVYKPAFINDEFVGKGIDSSAKLYKRLPDVGNVRVFLFVYLRECHNDSYPAMELQTFDSDNSCIDRLLVSTSIFEEGGLFRYSEIDLNYRIRVKDIVITYDLENDGEEEGRMETLHDYTVDDNGFFIKI